MFLNIFFLSSLPVVRIRLFCSRWIHLEEYYTNVRPIIWPSHSHFLNLRPILDLGAALMNLGPTGPNSVQDHWVRILIPGHKYMDLDSNTGTTNTEFVLMMRKDVKEWEINVYTHFWLVLAEGGFRRTTIFLYIKSPSHPSFSSIAWVLVVLIK